MGVIGKRPSDAPSPARAAWEVVMGNHLTQWASEANGPATRCPRAGRPSDFLGVRGVWEITSHSGHRRQTARPRAVTWQGGLGGGYGKSPHTVGVGRKRPGDAFSPGRAAFRSPWWEVGMGNHLTQWASEAHGPTDMKRGGPWVGNT